LSHVERILSLWGFKNDYPPSKVISRKLRISVHFPTAAYDLAVRKALREQDEEA
jgi:hypothetical protein